MRVFDENRLERQLQKLAVWKRVAFMAQTGVRMIPNYRLFAAETGFGDPAILGRAYDAIWTWVESEKLPQDLTALQDACERLAPNTEEFRSPYTSSALDAANAAAATLDAIANPQQSRPVEVASLARDTVDLFVQEVLNLDPNASNFEETILQHDLMQRELRRQEEDIERLLQWTGPRSTASRELRGAAEARSGSLAEL